MSAFVDKTGMRYGRLVAIRRAPSTTWRVRWLCVCDCGRQTDVLASALVQGSVRSCGCLHDEVRRRKGRNITHGRSKTTTYKIWTGLHKRCNNPRSLRYARYGGRGIAVCARWRSFENFLADMGECPPGLSIDRIDNDGNYEPSNCRWATDVEQARNRASVRLFRCGSELLTMPEIEARTGVRYGTVYYRLQRNPDYFAQA